MTFFIRKLWRGGFGCGYIVRNLNRPCMLIRSGREEEKKKARVNKAPIILDLKRDV